MSPSPAFRIATAIVLPVVVLGVTGASPMFSAEPPEWADPNAPLPCDRLGEVTTDILGGGETVSFSFDLDPGVYSFAGWASLDLLSLRMEIRDPIGTLLARDEGDDNSPVCVLDLESAGTVEVVLSAGEARVAGVPGLYAFAAATGDKCFERRASPGKEILDDWTGVVAEEGAEVSFWEVVELVGEDSILFTYQLAAGLYTAIAETGDPHDDIDMYVRLDPETIISRDELPNNIPVCHFELDFDAEITIEIEPWEYGNGDTSDLVLVLARDVDTED